MGRNASGAYSLPSGNPVVTGTTIDITWANDTLTDLAAEITDSLSRSGKGGMTAPLKGLDGTAAAPAFAFTGEAATGMYLEGAGDLGIAVSGVQLVDLQAGVLEILSAGAGAALGPILNIYRNSASPADADFIGALYFSGEDDGGNETIYAAVAAQIDDVTGGTEDGTLLLYTMEAGTLTAQVDISSAGISFTPPVTFAGGSIFGGDLVSDTDSTDDLGQTATRWANLWVDDIIATTSAIIGTMTISGGSILDSSGAITFGNENLVTTGTLGAGVATFTDTISGTMTLGDGSIVDSSGAITFGNENLVTTGTLGAGVTTVSSLISGTLTATSGSITDSSGAISFGNEDLSTTGTLGVGIASPDGTLHVHTATAGTVAPPTAADDLIVENSGAVGVSLLCPDLNTAYLNFGSPADNVYAQIRAFYNAGSPRIQFFAGGAEQFRLNDDGTVAGGAIATAAEVDAGSVLALVTTPGVEETRKRFRAVISTATAVQSLVPATHAGTMLIYTGAGAATWTIDTGWTAGDAITIIQAGAGQITLVAGTAVLNNSDGLKSASQNSMIMVAFEATGEAYVGGNTVA